ncbi:hypothetical protein D187_002997 [Cystobacter fuscus DSM 2262]|uniref:Uncharacterized protein n=1 Tax=Cystobacter fuscus (strain ATCC 25194 / DSM 2262 / NBRC 100088 / M29) TaxID=1242864 RepID=S9PB52_CYSF2|nr:hypothetical protein D187_002997 [Cystobacter fuscus DSM 2262]
MPSAGRPARSMPPREAVPPGIIALRRGSIGFVLLGSTSERPLDTRHRPRWNPPKWGGWAPLSQIQSRCTRGVIWTGATPLLHVSRRWPRGRTAVAAPVGRPVTAAPPLRRTADACDARAPGHRTLPGSPDTYSRGRMRPVLFLRLHDHGRCDPT